MLEYCWKEAPEGNLIMCGLQMLRNHDGQTLEEKMFNMQVMSMVLLLEMLAGANIRCL